MVNGDGGFLMALFLRFIFIFMNAGEYIAGGPDFPDQGGSISSQLCVFVAEPLLLKCNHSNLPPWFPIERISSPSLPEWNLWLFGISHPLPLPGCLQTADTGFSVLRAVGIFFWSAIATFQ